MFSRIAKHVSSLSPRLTMATVLVSVGAVVGGVLFLTRAGSGSGEADAQVEPFAARVDSIDGNVEIGRADDSETDLVDARLNTALTIGDRIATSSDSHCSISMTSHSFVELNPDTALDVLQLSDRNTQLALHSGSAIFDVRVLNGGEFYEVATPNGAIDFDHAGFYQIGVDGANSILSVLSGSAHVVGTSGWVEVGQGEVFTLAGTNASEGATSTLAPKLAGSIVDDYYRKRCPHVYDGRYADYDAYIADPFYYDRYFTTLTFRHVRADIPGLYELDNYGDWEYLPSYGYCWSPRVSANWAPFRYGYWHLNGLWGPTWVSEEAWGWAPYHYGRWTFTRDRWFWVTSELTLNNRYCPAPVAFIPLTQTSQLAWVPLAPGEGYVPRYYDTNFRPRYLASPEVIQTLTVQRNFINVNAPSGVTAVPVQALTRRIDPSVTVEVGSNAVAGATPAIDPFAIDSVRRAAMEMRNARRRADFTRLDRARFNTPVVTTNAPASLSARPDLARMVRVREVEKEKGKKLRNKENPVVVSGRRFDGLPQLPTQRPQATGNGPTSGESVEKRDRRMAELSARAVRGDALARRELRRLRREKQAQEQSSNPGQSASPPAATKPPASTRQDVQHNQPSQQVRRQVKPERSQKETIRPQPNKSPSSRQEMQHPRQQKRKPPPQMMRQQSMNPANGQAQFSRGHPQPVPMTRRLQRRDGEGTLRQEARGQNASPRATQQNLVQPGATLNQRVDRNTAKRKTRLKPPNSMAGSVANDRRNGHPS